MKVRILRFQSDPKLRRGDRVPRVLHDHLGQRVLAKHWPIVVGATYEKHWWDVHVGKLTASCEHCGANMRCNKTNKEVDLYGSLSRQA
jgi:hypothetical protein